MNSKELQMKADDKTGFIYQQKFLLRFVFITALFIALMVVFRFLLPIDYAAVSMFASAVVGTLLGTYVAAFVIKASEVVDENSDKVEEIIKDTYERGKEFVDDLSSDQKEEEGGETQKHPEASGQGDKKPEKSARERLRDKGLLK
eukprot:CAMPEP_0116040824 /NCGR_PEP_ID=MMETSP0321-20121206/24621_1 /TAXON_ID=163516 /ORGANISM="Leptocylindrus danicus var. danicus, Strain B650" /LENGTH=144 /DNA_ID=CAMNT_0003520777 /DNA_START=428 /DNA_END=862 /DNA_ORIENTATION=-